MTRFAAFIAFFAFVSTLTAADWPQWRGPNRDGLSAEKGLLTEWPKDGPKLLWKYPDAGLGFSSMAIRDGKLYTLGTKGDREVVLALDAIKGTELWAAKIGPIFTCDGNVWGDGPRSTPTLDGNLLFALFGDGDLVCLDLAKNGAEVWRKNLAKDFDGEMMTVWGYSESPLIDGDNVLVTPGGKKGLVVALNKKTGALVWQSAEVPHFAPYSSIVAAEIGGVRQYLQLSYVKEPSGGFINSLAAKNGKLLWQQPIFKGDSYAACPTPVVRDNIVYVTTGYGGGCHAFELDKTLKAKDLYTLKNQKTTKNTHGGVVLVGDKIYGHSEGLFWVCQDLKTGKIAWNESDALNARSAATLAVGDMLYLFTDEGDMGLAKANSEKFDLVSEFKLPELSKFTKTRPTSRQSKAWNHPAIANGKLYLRDCEFIYCYDIAKK